MILQALTEYYQRKGQAGEQLPARGFEEKEIPFILVIDEEGHFLHWEDTRELEGKKLVGKTFLVPKGVGRSGVTAYSMANTLWGHYGFVLAHPKEVPAKLGTQERVREEEKNQHMAKLQYQAFTQKVEEIHAALPHDQGVAAVLTFLQSENERAKAMDADNPNWVNCKKINGCNVAFRLQGEPTALVCQSALVQAYQAALCDEDEKSSGSQNGICLISGKESAIMRLHTKISGITKIPTPLAAVNRMAGESYGKVQGRNFPVGAQAEFEYTTALNTLLSSKNCFYIAKTTMLCWAEKAAPLETSLALFFCGSGVDTPDLQVGAVKSLYASIRNGAYIADDGSQRFYVLGLSPNDGRIVVRFWEQSTVAELSVRIAQYFEDLRLERGTGTLYPEYMPLLHLLCNLVLGGKANDLPPNLVGTVAQRILAGQPLPITLLQLALRRNRAEQKVDYPRASLIKAYLNRAIRADRYHMKEIPVALDTNRNESGYCLGRLFAVLEKTQEEAIPGVNAGIGTRYYGAACSTPVTVFATLLRLNQHHLAKLSGGREVNLSKLISSIMDKLSEFPAHLPIEQQALFALGYYHQRQDLFTSKKTDAILPAALAE